MSRLTARGAGFGRSLANVTELERGSSGVTGLRIRCETQAAVLGLRALWSGRKWKASPACRQRLGDGTGATTHFGAALVRASGGPRRPRPLTWQHVVRWSSRSRRGDEPALRSDLAFGLGCATGQMARFRAISRDACGSATNRQCRPTRTDFGWFVQAVDKVFGHCRSPSTLQRGLPRGEVGDRRESGSVRGSPSGGPRSDSVARVVACCARRGVGGVASDHFGGKGRISRGGLRFVSAFDQQVLTDWTCPGRTCRPKAPSGA